MGNIFWVKFCNMTPMDQITKMTRMWSYYIAYGRLFRMDLKKNYMTPISTKLV